MPTLNLYLRFNEWGYLLNLMLLVGEKLADNQGCHVVKRMLHEGAQNEAVGEDDPRLAPIALGAVILRPWGHWCSCCRRNTDMTTIAPSLARWLSAADSSARLDPWESPDATLLESALIADDERPDAVRTAVLTISGMPRTLRQRVETAMVVCMPSPPDLSTLEEDPLTASWFTSWWRDRPSERAEDAGVLLECRQVLTGPAAELDRLRVVIEGLASEYFFSGELRIVD